MKFQRMGFLLLACLLFMAPYGFGDDAPPWLTQAAAIKLPAYDKEVDSVVLVDEAKVSVDEEGRSTKAITYAVRILRREGRGNAVARAGYIPDSSKVKDFNAWLIRENGLVKKYGKDDTSDAAANQNDVYNEYRIKSIVAADDVEGNSVFGFSYIIEDRSVFSQEDWAFQTRNPVIHSRYSISIPSGWRAEGIVFNHAKIEPVITGSTYTWELRDLPPIPDEPMSPADSNLAARMAVSFFPPQGHSTKIKSFSGWGDVGAWMSELADPQAIVDDAITEKAKELTASAKTEIEKIRNIGKFAQSIRYIAISTGIGRGGGYIPHPAPLVLAKLYGDCKDKTVLMRALLKAAGIASYSVSIYSGDREYVRPEWPSPQQFNHAITAIKVSDETQAPTIISHPKFGRLMVFDPTDSETPVGDLPIDLQGSLALIDAKDSDALVKMPITPPEMNRRELRAELRLSGSGSIVGIIKEESGGQVASRERSLLRNTSRTDYNTMIEYWLSSSVTAAKINKINPVDYPEEGRFELDVDFAAPSYAQLMQNRLLVFKPAIISRLDSLTLTAATRKHPIVLEARSFSETTTIKLPSGFAVDEVPDAVQLDTPFGTFATSYEILEDKLIFQRKQMRKSMTMAPEQYDVVRKFFESIRAAEQSPVVLIKR